MASLRNIEQAQVALYYSCQADLRLPECISLRTESPLADHIHLASIHDKSYSSYKREFIMTKPSF